MDKEQLKHMPNLLRVEREQYEQEIAQLKLRLIKSESTAERLRTRLDNMENKGETGSKAISPRQITKSVSPLAQLNHQGRFMSGNRSSKISRRPRNSGKVSPVAIAGKRAFDQMTFSTVDDHSSCDSISDDIICDQSDECKSKSTILIGAQKNSFSTDVKVVTSKLSPTACKMPWRERQKNYIEKFAFRNSQTGHINQRNLKLLNSARDVFPRGLQMTPLMKTPINALFGSNSSSAFVTNVPAVKNIAVSDSTTTSSAAKPSVDDVTPYLRKRVNTVSKGLFVSEVKSPRNRHKISRSPVAVVRSDCVGSQSPIPMTVLASERSAITQGRSRSVTPVDFELYTAKGTLEQPSPEQLQEIRAANEFKQDDHQGKSREETKSPGTLFRESEELARQMMEEDQNQFMQQLHEAQLAAVARMRHENDESSVADGSNQPIDDDVAFAMRLHQEEQVGMYQGDDEYSMNIDPDNMTYEQMLDLGEQIGDVRLEHWRQRASSVISKLPITVINSVSAANSHTETTLKSGSTSEICLVCQCSYEDGDRVMHLPCKHYYHADCIDQWLQRNNTCPVCKASIEETPSKESP